MFSFHEPECQGNVCQRNVGRKLAGGTPALPGFTVGVKKDLGITEQLLFGIILAFAVDLAGSATFLFQPL
jgi:hypothetical protein